MSSEPQPDCYAVLGIPSGAKDEIVRAAYKVMLHRYRRGRLPGAPEEIERRMAEAARAHELLTDPARRRRYDLQRRIDASTGRCANEEPATLGARLAAAVIGAGGQPGLVWATLLLGFLVVAATVLSPSRARNEPSLPSAALPRPAAELAKPIESEATVPPARQVPVVAENVPATQQAAVPPVAASVSGVVVPAPPQPLPVRRSPPRPRGTAADAAPCTDVLTALGLCRPGAKSQEKQE